MVEEFLKTVIVWYSNMRPEGVETNTKHYFEFEFKLFESSNKFKIDIFLYSIEEQEKLNNMVEKDFG